MVLMSRTDFIKFYATASHFAVRVVIFLLWVLFGCVCPARVFVLRVRGAVFFCCGCAARFFSAGLIFLLRACPGVGRPAGGRIFLLRVRSAFFFAAGARQVHSLTCCPPPPSIHCRKTSRVLGALFFGCGCASPLTHSLPAARSTHSNKAPTAKKKHGFPHFAFQGSKEGTSGLHGLGFRVSGASGL